MPRLAASIVLCLSASAAMAGPAGADGPDSGSHLLALIAGGVLGALVMAGPSLPRPPVLGRLLRRPA